METPKIFVSPTGHLLTEALFGPTFMRPLNTSPSRHVGPPKLSEINLSRWTFAFSAYSIACPVGSQVVEALTATVTPLPDAVESHTPCSRGNHAGW